MNEVSPERQEPEEITPLEEMMLAVPHPNDLSPVERLHIFVEKFNAVGRKRMLFADHFIQEGLMKRRIKK